VNLDLTTRPLAARDRPAWDELWAIYLAFYGETLSDAVTEATWRRVLHREQGLGGIVAVRGEQVVGVAHHVIHPHTWGTGDVCYLEDLVVHPDHRGAGVGRRLIEALSLRARELGCASVYWITQEDNEVARRLYDRVATRSPYVRYEIDLG
jgi:ribosomal protein S18 acetylase RimI-like enzyme